MSFPAFFARLAQPFNALKEESSFLKKRSKRLLLSRSFPLGGHGQTLRAGAGVKGFWFFSSEKNSFPKPSVHRWSSGAMRRCMAPAHHPIPAE
jgi:hypothetical protein